MRFLHTMLRVRDIDAATDFVNKLGLREVRRNKNEGGRFTLVFLNSGAPDDPPKSSSRTTGTNRSLRPGAFSGTSLTKSTTSMKLVLACKRRESTSCARRATATWPSWSRPMGTRSRSCKRAWRSRQKNPGNRCPTREAGDFAVLSRLAVPLGAKCPIPPKRPARFGWSAFKRCSTSS